MVRALTNFSGAQYFNHMWTPHTVDFLGYVDGLIAAAGSFQITLIWVKVAASPLVSKNVLKLIDSAFLVLGASSLFLFQI